jgi:hypothetical protein
MRPGERAILDAVNTWAGSMDGRLGRIEQRLDTLIDAVAELRRDFDTHNHNGQE